MGILTTISLFTGIGGLDLGAKLAGGFKTICYIENEPYCQKVLQARIKDGLLDDAPIWDDIRTFKGKTWRGSIDVIFGGFPCQNVSVAGKQAGIKVGTNSGLWIEFARIVGEVRPQFVFIENVRGLVKRGLGYVLKDLSCLGYDAEWRIISAAEVGAPHKRERIFIVAYAKGQSARRLSIGKKEKEPLPGVGGCNERKISNSRRFPKGGQESRFDNLKINCKAERIESKKGNGPANLCQDVADPNCDRKKWSKHENRERGGLVVGREGKGIRSKMADPKPKPAGDQSRLFKNTKNEERRDSKAGGEVIQSKNRKACPSDPESCRSIMADPHKSRMEKWESIRKDHEQKLPPVIRDLLSENWWTIEPELDRLVNELPSRVDRIKAIGNAVVPIQSLWGWERIKELKNECSRKNRKNN